MKKINKDFDMDPFKRIPVEIVLEILTLVPVESVFHCESVCRNWRKIVDIHFNDRFRKLQYKTRLDILSRLPGDTVLDCRSVCRNWRKIVGVVSKDPEFIRMHLNHPSAAAQDTCKLGVLALTERGCNYFECNDDHNHELILTKHRMIDSGNIDDSSYLVGSCNGLICLARNDGELPVCIFNPLTREYVELPKIRNPIDPFDNNEWEWDDWSFGFGYVSATNEYKVVGIYVSSSGYLEVYIYAVGTNRWRNLGTNFSFEFRPEYAYVHGSFANGAIYWIGNEVQKIVTFDLTEEKFCEHLAPPPLPPNRSLIHHTLGVLEGILYIAIFGEEGCYDIWLLKEKNNNHDKGEDKHQSFEWSKELRVNQRELIAATKSGGVLTYYNNDYYLNIYDTKASTSEMLWDFKDEMVLQVFPHKHTFVSLKDSGEEQAKKLKSVKGGRKL